MIKISCISSDIRQRILMYNKLRIHLGVIKIKVLIVSILFLLILYHIYLSKE